MEGVPSSIICQGPSFSKLFFFFNKVTPLGLKIGLVPRSWWQNTRSSLFPPLPPLPPQATGSTTDHRSNNNPLLLFWMFVSQNFLRNFLPFLGFWMWYSDFRVIRPQAVQFSQRQVLSVWIGFYVIDGRTNRAVMFHPVEWIGNFNRSNSPEVSNCTVHVGTCGSIPVSSLFFVLVKRLSGW